MTDRELEQRLADAVERAAPDDLDAILSRCGAQNGRVTKLNTSKTDSDKGVIELKAKKRLIPWVAAACAALVLAGGAGGFYYHQTYAVASVVSLDVNPSIELRVNRAERVISCAALNQEAAAVLFDMDGGADLEGAKLDVAVNAVVGALVQAGYLDSLSSAILISVDDNDQARAARLQQELVASVDGVLQVQAPGTSVLSQVLTQDAQLAYGSFDSGISAGKAALVQKVMAMNGTTGDTAVFEKLAALSVEELNDLLKTGARQIPIGRSAAAAAAEEYAGTAALDSVTADVDPDLDEVPAHYDVELRTAWGEFDYMVDAFTGAVLSGQANIPQISDPGTPDTGAQAPSDPASGTQTPNTNTQTPSGQTPNTNTQTPSNPASGTQTPSTNTQTPSAQTQDIGQAAAKAAALKHAGLSESQVTSLIVKREWDNGRLEYDVEFWNGTTEYDYTIDASTGSVLKSEREDHGGTGAGAGTQPSAGTSDIGQAAAKAAALKHAGLSESQVTSLTVKRDWDNGRLEYDVEFWNGTTEYDYTIDGVTGSVLKSEREDHTGAGAGAGTQPSAGTSDIGQAAAKAAALKHAGLSESQVTGMSVKQDWDDGRLEYDVEFWCGTTEYDYTIDGYSGAVLKHEWDQHNSSHHTGTGTSANTSDIGQAAAKAAALKHAGVSESQTYGMKVERDWDDGRLEYEVEFKAGGMEYEYTIDGATGAILQYERDIDD